VNTVTHELVPGIMTATFGRLARKSRATGAAAITSLALAVERRAKEDLAKTTHRRGTPSPAHKGGPPALVSGTLRRAVTHTRAKPTATGWEIRVGVAAGFYPPYPRKGKKTEAAKYGRYLEEVWDYPWLVPAFEAVTSSGSGNIGRFFAADWRRL
jgi:hypothetical protein